MEEPEIIQAHASHVMQIGFSHDSRILITTGMDNVIKFWSAPSWDFEG